MKINNGKLARIASIILLTGIVETVFFDLFTSITRWETILAVFPMTILNFGLLRFFILIDEKVDEPEIELEEGELDPKNDNDNDSNQN